MPSTEKEIIIDIVKDISLLYELSLSVGKSLKLKENCDHFLKVLMARKSFTFAGVWLRQSVFPKTSSTGDNYISVYAFPQSLLRLSVIPSDHSFFKKFTEQKFKSYTAKDHNALLKIGDRVQDEKGVYLIYRLGELGFLKLYSPKTSEPYSRVEMNKLYSVISKFSMSIQASLEHEKGLIEAEQRIRAEKELVEKHKLYIELVKNLQEGFVITDREDKILFTNEQMAQLTGYSIQELIGQKAYQLFLPPQVWDLFENKQLRRIQGQSETYEIEQYCKDGSTVWVQVNAVPYKDAEGNIIGTFALISNIDKRKLAEKALKRSEEKLSLIIDTALDAVITIDQKSTITQWNKQAELIFGWAREEVVGRNMSEIIMPKQHILAHHQGMKRYLKTGEANVVNKRIEITAIRKNGEEFPIELAISPIEFETETHFSAFVRDITERNKAEQDLIVAKQAAEESAKAKELFLAKMSHEIRTPMNAIFGLSEIMLKTRINPEQNKYLDAIRFSAKNLSVIINDILDFSKIEADKLTLEEIPFNLKEVVENIDQLVHHKAEEKGVTFHVSFNQTIQEVVLGDPVRLNQVLLNMVNNAIKFTEKGSVKLKCSLQTELEGKQFILFQIEDTGSGIPDEKLHHIFNSFEQADTSISRKYGGTGLGLTISKQLIELMGGEISVRSLEGVGTIFSFIVPFQKVEQSVLEKIENNPLENKTFDGFHILIVEDNKINSFFTSTILTQRGFQVDIAENGKIALEKLEQNHFDIVLMDIQMPVMNGIETTKVIRNEKKSDVIIIALTANAFQQDLDHYKAIGMNDHVVKPFEQITLIEKIDLYLPEQVSQEKPPPKPITPSKVEVSDKPMLFDLSNLKIHANQNDAFIKRMIEIFKEDVPEMLSSMEKSFLQGDFTIMSEVAHKLKSSIDLLKIELLKEPIREIEKFQKHQLNPTDLKERIELTKKVCHEVIEGLENAI